MLWRTLLGTAVAGFVLCFGFFYYLNSREVPEAELLRRCTAARPAWQSYQEDIKAEVGAGPVAAWRGRPIEAQFDVAEISVVFEVAGEWAERDVLLPVLLQLPTGEVVMGSAGTRGVGRRTYVFAVDPAAPRPSWAELKYPHRTIRIVPDAEGTWRAPEPAA